MDARLFFPLLFLAFKFMVRLYLSKRELMLLISYKKQSSSAPGADAEVVKTSLLTTSAATAWMPAFFFLFFFSLLNLWYVYISLSESSCFLFLIKNNLLRLQERTRRLLKRVF